ncbi:MAG: hypothetical protein ETSY1_43375 [Candidatus Entotheonella factor]|uniref:Uncharacterized protein n=1 Tax=Entotheonella factor TaxID=1429438 RepID=W4L581_ENTF1|nr:MAG: hypothetical protein ETSY1_43375 [Candidatus Entotheonella factor]
MINIMIPYLNNTPKGIDKSSHIHDDDELTVTMPFRIIEERDAGFKQYTCRAQKYGTLKKRLGGVKPGL